MLQKKTKSLFLSQCSHSVCVSNFGSIWLLFSIIYILMVAKNVQNMRTKIAMEIIYLKLFIGKSQFNYEKRYTNKHIIYIFTSVRENKIKGNDRTDDKNQVAKYQHRSYL